MSQNGAVKRTHPPQIKACDVYLMAVRLLAQHGAAALEVAAFSEKEHALRGDTLREAAWHAVRSTLDDMLRHRLAVDGIRVH